MWPCVNGITNRSYGREEQSERLVGKKGVGWEFSGGSFFSCAAFSRKGVFYLYLSSDTTQPSLTSPGCTMNNQATRHHSSKPMAPTACRGACYSEATFFGMKDSIYGAIDRVILGGFGVSRYPSILILALALVNPCMAVE